MYREEAFQLMCEYTQSESLRKHMQAVEIAMRAYARKLGEDEEKWGIVGLLHDFDYERWPNLPDHPMQGSAILESKGYSEEVRYAIKSHCAEATGCPRRSALDKALFACDELSGFIVAAAYVRPEGIHGMQASSITKKMKQKAFAASVSRDDITNGASEFGVELNDHIQFLIDALSQHSELLGIGGKARSNPTTD